MKDIRVLICGLMLFAAAFVISYDKNIVIRWDDTIKPLQWLQEKTTYTFTSPGSLTCNESGCSKGVSTETLRGGGGGSGSSGTITITTIGGGGGAQNYTPITTPDDPRPRERAIIQYPAFPEK